MPILQEIATVLNESLKPLDVLNHPSKENLEWVIQNYLPKLDAMEYFDRVIAYDRYLND